MKINPGKSKALSFTRTWLKDPLNYSVQDQVILEAGSCKYLGIILCSDLSWSDHVYYMVTKARRHFSSKCVFLKWAVVIQKVRLHFSSVPDSRVWGFVLGSI
jgi:hypothetical protein